MNRLTHSPMPGLSLAGAPASSEEKMVLHLLSQVALGAVTIQLPRGDSVRLGPGDHPVIWNIHDDDVFSEVLAAGDIGLGESWMRGGWGTDDLTGLLTFLARNRDALGKAVYGHPLRLLGHRLWHRFRVNTRAGSRRNIAAHYDLGNDFYRLWLDESMSYSAALFGDAPQMDLAAAQRMKYLRILDRLDPRPGDRILEIGCGWGGFAEVAAQDYGCRVEGITLSSAQLAFARQRAEQGGWSGQAEFRYQDYRDVQGQYDHIVSVEMFEAVGERFWPGYFRGLRRLLKPGGRAVVQTITIADDLFRRYRRGTDFIQRYIFPGGMLPSPARFESLARKQGLAVDESFAFGMDYARTLNHWHRRFNARLDGVKQLGFDDHFIRMWQFYLAYCEAGFLAGSTDVRQYLLQGEI